MSRSYIKGGTPVGSESLCRTCSWSQVITGYRESERITVCIEVQPNIIVPFNVHECTRYNDRNRPTWEQMQKLAIHVTPTRPVGFKTGPGFAPARITVGDDDESEDEDPTQE